jgi:hypothetical protein
MTDLDFQTFKMPIIEDRNDVPSILGDINHPNGALFCSNFNNFINNVLGKSGETLVYTIYFNQSDTTPNNTSTFNNPVRLVNHLRYTFAVFTESNLVINLVLRSNFSFPNFKLDLNLRDITTPNFKFLITGETSTRTISFASISCSIPLAFGTNISLGKGDFYNSNITFENGSSIINGKDSSFTNCNISFAGTSLGSGLNTIYLYNSIWTHLKNTYLKIIAKNSIIYHKGEIYQPVDPVDNLVSPKVEIEAEGGSIELDRLKTNYLKLRCKNSKIYLKNSQCLISPGISPNNCLDVDILNCKFYIESSSIADNTTSKIYLRGSTLFYNKSIFTTANGTNLHLESECSMVISQTDPSNQGPTEIGQFGTLPSLANAVIFEDGVLLGR